MNPFDTQQPQQPTLADAMIGQILRSAVRLAQPPQWAQPNPNHPSVMSGSETEQERQALLTMPSAAQLGGNQPYPFVRMPFFPTAPWMSTNPNVGYQTRYYQAQVASNAADYTVGSVSMRNANFDLPVRVVAINAAARPTNWSTPPTINGVDYMPTDQSSGLLYSIQVVSPSGDKLHVQPLLGSTVVGFGRQPGEIGGHGYNVDNGGSLQINIIPWLAGLTIDICFVCLELRAPRNFAIR